MLSKTEFDILYYLLLNKCAGLTQRELSDALYISLGKVNKDIKALTQKNLISVDQFSYDLTEDGIKALQPYKVDNAVIMAAGMSSRFAPLSYELPKGLLRVKDEILIEREIRQLQEAGISDITVVVGYMKEKFFYLEEKFGVKIVVNEDYFKYNNTSTLIRVVDQLKNTYICSSDNYFVDNVFESYVYSSYYAAVYSSDTTEEYCLDVDRRGRIKSVTIGGSNSWYMLGHVYFDQKFSDKFKTILIKEYDDPETRNHLWENLYMRHIKELDLYIRKYDSEKVLEFDSLDDLRKFDSTYINNVDSSIFRNICDTLDCEIKDVVNIKTIKAGLTNTSFQFSVGGNDYVYRHPGRGTEKYINRKSEAFSMEIASKLGLDNTFIFMDENTGWKLSKYIQNARELDYHNVSDVTAALALMRRLHSSNIISRYDFGIWDKTLRLIERLNSAGKDAYEDFGDLFNLMKNVQDCVSGDGFSTKCLCHNDYCSPHFLFDEADNIYLIDWEYSGNDDPASDLGTFICCSDYSYEEAIDIIEQYLCRIPSKEELRHYTGYIAIASYYWFVWALYQETRGNAVGEWAYLWYKSSKMYAEKTLEML